jgi:uncharacterized phiE125 gp8 family phage protein
MKYALEVVSAPPYEPVSLSDMKTWMRFESDDTSHDALIRGLIKAMREEAENLTGRAFIPRQLRLTLPTYPVLHNYGVGIELPHPPVVSVESFKYIDTNGDLQTLDTDQYTVYDEYQPGFILPAYLVSWPSIREQPNSIQVVYNAGYAPGSPADEAGYQASMPEVLRLWMESKASTHNEFREMIVSGTIVNKIPRDFTDALLDSLVLGSRLF